MTFCLLNKPRILDKSSFTSIFKRKNKHSSTFSMVPLMKARRGIRRQCCAEGSSEGRLSFPTASLPSPPYPSTPLDSGPCPPPPPSCSSSSTFIGACPISLALLVSPLHVHYQSSLSLFPSSCCCCLTLPSPHRYFLCHSLPPPLFFSPHRDRSLSPHHQLFFGITTPSSSLDLAPLSSPRIPPSALARRGGQLATRRKTSEMRCPCFPRFLLLFFIFFVFSYIGEFCISQYHS